MDLNTFTIIPYKENFLKLHSLRSGKIIYRDYFIDLLTGEKIFRGWRFWFDQLEMPISMSCKKPRLIHFYYEFGFLIENIQLENFEHAILGIDLEYDSFSRVSLSDSKPLELQLINAPLFDEYEKKFKRGYAELLAGNCYQFNLTEEFQYKLLKNYSVMEIIECLWRKRDSCGAFGSATYLPRLNRLLMSNSPECLFQLKNENGNFFLETMPIKGTIFLQDKKLAREKWKELCEDKKCESELFMIADLLRNDLSRIEFPRSQILSKKAPLFVPGLVHQYSHLSVELTGTVKLKTIIQKMFPGGSITGAPKKRVMQILRKLENRDRKFYCGSTLIFFKEMKAASINIRSAEFDLVNNEFSYSAGGGITLRSLALSEFQEMSYKVESFVKLLTD